MVNWEKSEAGLDSTSTHLISRDIASEADAQVRASQASRVSDAMSSPLPSSQL